MDKKSDVLSALKELKELMKKTKDKRIYASALHVSNSGMSRVIKFCIITKKGELYNINNLVHRITGYNWDQNYYGLRVYGCGMDMIFNTLYNINAYASSYGIIKSSKKTSKHDLYYNGLVNTSYYTL